MTSYYVFSALAAQREAEIERQAAIAQRSRARARAAAAGSGRRHHGRRWLGWHGPRRLRLV
jgi:hypothetical protein